MQYIYSIYIFMINEYLAAIFCNSWHYIFILFMWSFYLLFHCTLPMSHVFVRWAAIYMC